MPETASSPAPVTVVIETRGQIPEAAHQLVRTGIGELDHGAGLLIRQARIRLTHLGDRSLRHPAVVQGNLDIGGIPVRVQTAAHSVQEAVHLLCERLRERLARLLRTDGSYRGLVGAPRESPRWRTADRDIGGRIRITRRKTVELRRETADEAAFRMDAMDYDCHLFSDADTGQDSMVFRSGPTGYSLAQLSVRSGPPRRRNLPITVRPRPAPHLTPGRAAAQLDRTGLPFLFFADTTTHPVRTAALYERFDGHYGLLLARPRPVG
ncbi:sigma 54 modulation/S30EA ribosomal C-terminal domain-containing protein [Streptacidiphilus carbonis]|uniref:sigma 54 modulation/S30EA ribosomal C-terminal domain-containing protein n=1 Tax=Streptacidiphilus carbonis TaxID=105422 RepID=UPI0007C7680C|nr:sigma 54 modulation/S30EA ribosomal C-terminal domain-containing protein [Streptacidiphilus carbonis]